MILNKRFLLIFPLAIFVVFGAIAIVRAQTADVIHACVAQPNSNNRSQNIVGEANTGSVRIVTDPADCRSDEQYVSWNAQGSQGLPGPSGAPGPSGVPGPAGGSLKVVDSLGQELGTLLDANHAIRQINGVWVSFYVWKDGFDNDVWFQYESPDCSGTAYMFSNQISNEGEVIGNTLYYPGEITQLPYYSTRTLQQSGEYGPCYSNDGGVVSPYGPVQTYEFPNLTPPFHVVQQ